MAGPYQLEKSLWTAADFDVMGWHDVRVHAIAHAAEEWQLLLDLDYILQWVDPEPPAKHFSFWIAPATLLFQNVSELRIDLEPLGGFEIESVRQSEPIPMRDGFHDSTLEQRRWTVAFFNGEIQFLSTGYRQYIRRSPEHRDAQHLDLHHRGGFSFEMPRDDQPDQHGNNP